MKCFTHEVEGCSTPGCGDRAEMPQAKIRRLEAEVERLKDLVIEVQNRTVVVVRQRAIDDHLDIVAGFAREAAYSGERHVLLKVAQAIRDRK